MASMNKTPSGERIHIGFFGRRNAGKSSVVNALTGQEIAIVSDVRGTTTDPVSKAMEILPLGPVLIIDTPGFDDEGSLGDLRVKRTSQILEKTDIAILVVDAAEGAAESDEELAKLFRDRKIPYILVLNKSDRLENLGGEEPSGPAWASDASAVLSISALAGEGIEELKESIASLKPEEAEPRLIADKIKRGDLIVLVVPIDESAPKGRLILPQQQTIRDILDAGAYALAVKDSELEDLLASGSIRPDLVISDSQVFGKVDAIVPPEIPLTSFSILMARHKGLLEEALQGISAVNNLKDSDRVLIAEGCTHHRQCGDIGSVKIPKWLRGYTGKDLVIETASGTGFPEDLSDYALVIHCGGCMLSEREVKRRVRATSSEGTPITNYGTLIAFLNGILDRSLGIFPELSELLYKKA